jgi:hypothetical protein
MVQLVASAAAAAVVSTIADPTVVIENLGKVAASH